MKTKNCPVFTKSLLYFFYGRPTFEISPKVARFSRQPPDTAVAIAIDLKDVASSISAIYPFDTGGAHGQKYSQYIPFNLDYGDFALDRAIDTPAKYVSAFFDNNANYFDCKTRSKKDIGITHFNSSANVLHDLFNATSSSGFDDRVASVEVQINSEIDLNKVKVRAIIAPYQAHSDKNFDAACKSWGVNPIGYFARMSYPQAKTDVIFDRIGEMYRTMGWF